MGTVGYRLCRKGQIWLSYYRKGQQTLLITGFRGFHKKKKQPKPKVSILVISQRRFTIFRHIIYQINLFWTEICKDPNGHVRYIQSPPCTTLSHTQKTAEEKDNHAHKLHPNGSCFPYSSSSVKVRFHIPSSGQDKGWVCTSRRQRAQRAPRAGLHYSWHGQKSILAVWCASCTDSTHKHGPQPGLRPHCVCRSRPGPVSHSLSQRADLLSLSLPDLRLPQYLAPSRWTALQANASPAGGAHWHLHTGHLLQLMGP